MAQLAKNPPALQETWVRSLGWEDPLEKGKATNSSILAWRIPWTVWGSKESDTTERLSLWVMQDLAAVLRAAVHTALGCERHVLTRKNL